VQQRLSTTLTSIRASRATRELVGGVPAARHPIQYVQETTMSVHPVPPSTPPGGRGRGEQRRADAVDRLLTSLEHLVRRHRALAADGGHIALHAELVTAEVAHELALTRSDLQRHPPLTAIS
jgi:hypothetical protein